ncbi:hypothetical protein SAMN04487995_0144 [Dyadobacter koreensis]|uniref:Uncharacterized protein n=1 Tax=Dyadobacter koreensis TaxID=408657 RepID=A0A1H6Q0Z5_9BACT|nr:hypothetical protein [Dyadobacter koreensis]SEI37529.1 hypothetical protein SAMN04487995_0144 [Dyadobacter koreensis]
MDNTFELDVDFNGETFEFPGQLIISGYVHKIELDINGAKVLFEPDEERKYRALLSMQDLTDNQIEMGLIKAIVLRLDSLLS